MIQGAAATGGGGAGGGVGVLAASPTAPPVLCRAVEQMVSAMEVRLRRRQLTGSAACAKRTAEVLRMVVSKELRVTVPAVLELVRHVGERLNACSAVEFAIGNIVGRVRHIIREEALGVARRMMSGDDGATALEAGGARDNEDIFGEGGGRINTDIGGIDAGLDMDMGLPRTRTVSLHMLIESGGGSLSGAPGRTRSLENMPAIGEEDEEGGAGAAAGGRSAASGVPSNDGGGASLTDAGTDAGRQPRGSNGARQPNVGFDLGFGIVFATKKETNEFMRALRHTVIDCINELIDEVDTIEGLIAEQVR